MEVKRTICERRSVRKYKKEPVGQKDIVDILEAGMLAPSAVNLQPWYYVAIQDPEELNKLRNIMGRASARVEPELTQRFASHPDVVKDTLSFIGGLGDAPLVVLAFQNRLEYKQKEEAIVQSVAASIENMLLAAWDKGIGSCWMTAPLEAKVDDELRNNYAPDHGRLLAMITFGYPEIVPGMPKRRERKYILLFCLGQKNLRDELLI